MLKYRQRTRQERFWEILPGLAFWVVFSLAIFLSFVKPVWAALFIICFDLYWVMKAVNTAVHLISSYKIFQVVVKFDWLKLVSLLNEPQSLLQYLQELLSQANNRTARHFIETQIVRIKNHKPLAEKQLAFMDIYHLLIIPFVDESYEVLESTILALTNAHYPKDKLLLVLANEERAGDIPYQTALQLQSKFRSQFFRLEITRHPDGLPGEIKGKSANASFAVQAVLPLLEKLKISINSVLVSNFDSDTIIHPMYFARLTYEFLLQSKPYRRSYQPIAIYNNNIWDSPAFIRVVSVSNSFWQFTESSRPDRLRTFSSHSMPLKTLVEVGFWKKDIVNEDGFIFWQCYLHYEGDYQVVPLFIPISLDTCLAESFWQTLKNQYKQKRRWAYNVEYYPHLIPKLIKSKAPFWDRYYKMWQYVEGDFNWAAASILISTLGWLPLFVGGKEFTESVIAFNLPKMTQGLMTIATGFLIFSVYINLILLPPRPAKYGPFKSVMMYLQWFLVPLVSVVFGSLPAIEAQTRLMLGKYLEFWVTPKSRKGELTSLDMKEMQASGSPPR